MSPTEEITVRPAVPVSARVEFISRYKGLPATLVVLIHTGITYGGIGSWDFVESHEVLWLKVLTTCINCNYGPLWFVKALFLFSLVYVALKLVRRSRGRTLFAPGFPSRAMIFTYILAAAALRFAARLVFPIGWIFHNLQLGFFPMYIILFAAGIKAGEEEWLERIADVRIAPWMHSLPLHPALKWIMLSVSGVCLPWARAPWHSERFRESAVYCRPDKRSS
jgi:glucan biosynthesis protein C